MAGQAAAPSVVAGLSGLDPVQRGARARCASALAGAGSQRPTPISGRKALPVLAGGMALVRRRTHRRDDRPVDGVVALLLQAMAGHREVARTIFPRRDKPENGARSCRLGRCFSLTNTKLPRRSRNWRL